MKLITQVTPDVYQTIQTQGFITADQSKTDFSNYREHYQTLVDLSGLPAFFFGLLLPDDLDHQLDEHLRDLCGMSSSGNTILLELELPDDTPCHLHDYYTFSDYLYGWDETFQLRDGTFLIQSAFTAYMTEFLRKGPAPGCKHIQIIYPRIEKAWILSHLDTTAWRNVQTT